MNIDREPVVIAGLLTALIQATIIMAQQMNWIQLTDQQFAAVMAFVAAIIALGSFILRRYVTPLADPRDNEGRRLVPDGE